MLDKIVLIGGVLELIILVLIAIVSRDIWFRMKDYDCFGRIATGDFIFTPRYYGDNKRALLSYVNAYVNYGYNIRCDMTAEEFIHNTVKFMRTFIKYDKDREKTLKALLDNICTDVRKGIKLGDDSCKIRARYIMKKIEKIYANEINSDDEEIIDFVNEIQMLLAEETY
jgi:hypothetical protein